MMNDKQDAARLAQGDDKIGLPLSFTIDPTTLARLLDLFRETLETIITKALAQPPMPQGAMPRPDEPQPTP
jgi:hypothetical protein